MKVSLFAPFYLGLFAFPQFQEISFFHRSCNAERSKIVKKVLNGPNAKSTKRSTKWLERLISETLAKLRSRQRDTIQRLNVKK
jgi:hypothetical protein